MRAGVEAGAHAHAHADTVADADTDAHAHTDVRTPASPSLSPIDSVLRRMLDTRTAEGDGGAVIDISEYAVPEGAARVLEGAARDVAAESMLEVGLASGVSALSIARGRLAAGPMRAESFHVIDPCQTHFRRCGLLAIERAGLAPAVVFHPHPAHAVLPRLLEAAARFQFAFVDGLHQLDNVLVELFYLDLMLDVGGVIALHDMWMPGLQRCAAFWVANRAYEPVALHAGRLRPEPCESEKRGCGDPARRPALFRERIEPFVDWSVLLVRKVGEDERGWDEFVEFG